MRFSNLIGVALALVLAGCGGYYAGHRHPYQPVVDTTAAETRATEIYSGLIRVPRGFAGSECSLSRHDSLSERESNSTYGYAYRYGGASYGYTYRARTSRRCYKETLE